MIDDQLRTAAREAINGGLRQTELARRAGVPQPRVSRFLAGETIRLDLAAKIAQALGLELRRVRRSRLEAMP